MGGKLDTKNAKSNAEEVQKLQSIFSFIKNSNSYFATCYGTCSEAVRENLDKSQILNDQDFWNKILPKEINYNDFIKLFEKIFKKLKIEKTLKNLQI